nr:hypothetical protein [Bradyrhizobium stylosanthis]
MMNFSPLAVAKDKTVMVGGTTMYPTRSIVENAVKSKDHTTLVDALRRADDRRSQRGARFRILLPHRWSQAPRGRSFLVADQGVGMDANLMDRALEPFLTTKRSHRPRGAAGFRDGVHPEADLPTEAVVALEVDARRAGGSQLVMGNCRSISRDQCDDRCV